MIIVRLFPILLMIVAFIFGGLANGTVNVATDSPEVRVGSELDFPPYAFIDERGQPVGFSVDLIKAIAKAMSLPIKISTGTWDNLWNALVAGRLDILPIVAKLHDRLPLVDFSLPHTETYDAFFVRHGNPPLSNIEAARGKNIVVMRSDAAHHALLEHNFQGNLVLVDTIPEGLSLISSGKYDAFLGSKLIGTMLINKQGLINLDAGPIIPDYKRVFSFAVKKGNAELLEKLNQGLLIIKTNGEYDRIYEQWLTGDDPWRKWQKYFWPAIVIVIAIVLIGSLWLLLLQLQVKKRTRQLNESNKMLRLAQEGLEEKVAHRTGELANANVELQSEITERKEVEKALRASEEKFRTLYDNAPLGYQSLDEDGVIIEVNQTWLDTLGYCREEVIGKWSGDFQTPHSAESFPQRFARFKEDGQIRDVEVEMVSRDGTIIIASFNGNIAYDDQGKVTRTHCMFHDITERKRAREALAKNYSELQNATQRLEQSKNMLQLIIESIPVRVFWKDRELRFLGCNTLFARDAGLSKPEQLLGKDDFAMGWREQAEAYRADDRQVMESRRPKLNVVEPQTTPTGAKIWLNTSKVPLQMPNGEVFGVLGVYEDITARYQAEESLRESEERYRMVADYTYDMEYWVSSERKIGYMSPACERLTGYPAQAFVDDPQLLDRIVHPEDRALFIKHRKGAGSNTQIYDLDFRLIHRNGGEFWVNHTCQPVCGADGSPLGRRVCNRNITERKRAEEAFQSLVSSAPMGIYIVQDGKFAMVNPGFEVITGYHAQELIGQHCLNPVSPEFRAFVREQALLRLKEEGLPPYEYQFITKNGETGWVMEKVTPTQYKGKKAVMGYFMDISPLIEMEEQFLRAQKMEAVGTLAGGIAHDFNNILTAILGNIGLAALDDKIGPRGKDRLAQAEAACLRAEALSRQLLTFAKGGAPVEKICSVAELLSEAIAFACVGTPVKCETTFPENLWWIDADIGQIGQIFQNLTINAIHAMPTGGTIQVWAENLTLGAESGLPLSAGRYIKISVRDQGLGIPAEHMPRIFDPYFTTKHKGSGLGLASAYAIVNKHHGHIAVESKPGVGTTFHIYLPAVDQQATPQPKEDRELLVGTGKILVMDDEDMVREVLGRMLVSVGYEPEFAKDGGEAIEMYVQAQGSGQAFAAVILDLTVPGAMGGKETMARLLEIDPQVKAIVSSGYSDDPIMADFQKYGFNGVIVKPYRISELGKILHEVIMGKP